MSVSTHLCNKQRLWLAVIGFAKYGTIYEKLKLKLKLKLKESYLNTVG